MGDANQQEEVGVVVSAGVAAVVSAGVAEPFPFDMTKKKKRKKRGKFVLVELEGEDGAAPPETPRGEAGADAAGGGAADAAGGGADVGADVGAVVEVTPGFQEYSYPELLERIYEKMRKREGGGVDGGHRGRQLVLIPPQVFKIGSKKTCFSNFAEIAKRLSRAPEHLQEYLLVELGTSGTIDGTGSLIIKGKYGRGDVEGVLKRYIREYVRCQTCGSHDTRMERDKASRLVFLRCQACSAQSTLSKIKGGFSALTEKRSRIRRREGN